MTRIDLNADLGEGVSGDAGLDPDALDSLLLQHITSANVACGGHAGDDRSMRRVCAEAVEREVSIGAQVSYVDRAGFGRVRLDVPRARLSAQLTEQVEALREQAHAAGGTVSYLKPHGALYNAAADEEQVALAVVDAVLIDAERGGRAPLPVLTLPGCVLARAATARGVVVVAEAFADRAYTSAGRLVPRDVPGAVVDDADAVVLRVLRLASQHVVRSIDGVDVTIEARSVCLHSDTPGAARTATLVRAALDRSGVTVAPFAVHA